MVFSLGTNDRAGGDGYGSFQTAEGDEWGDLRRILTEILPPRPDWDEYFMNVAIVAASAVLTPLRSDRLVFGDREIARNIRALLRGAASVEEQTLAVAVNVTVSSTGAGSSDSSNVASTGGLS